MIFLIIKSEGKLTKNTIFKVGPRSSAIFMFHFELILRLRGAKELIGVGQ